MIKPEFVLSAEILDQSEIAKKRHYRYFGYQFSYQNDVNLNFFVW